MEALLAVGVGLQVFGSVSQAAAAKKAGKYNAAVANQEGANAMAAAAFEEAQTRREFARLMGTQRAGYSASNVAVDQDTPLLVNMEQAGEAELQAAAIRYGGEVARANAGNRAKMAKFNADQAATAALWSAASSIVTGASTVFGGFSSTAPKALSSTAGYGTLVGGV